MYINVVAVKGEYQNDINVLRTLVKAVKDMLENLEELPDEVYAVGVTDLGRKMCSIISNQSKLSRDHHLVSVANRTEVLHGETVSHERALYKFDTDYFISRINSICRE